MEPRMYRAEPSLVMNAERSAPKLPLCPSCARNVSAHCPTYVRLNAGAAACLISKNMSCETQRCVVLK